ncbi:MAG TPA: hypothetical protein DER23_07960 [Clostridiales bacterium]|jgi:1-acyl-sn-glycerol-3-phosphate acyltransferase|nr:hypothetical protein [Clostridiales bacterium]HCG36262.1 hypothetical protein [Clostridiales bacterium]
MKKQYNMNKFYRFWFRIVPPLTKWLYRLDAEGVDKQPKIGPFVVCANHLSNLDPILVGCNLYTQLIFMAKKELMKVPVIGWFCRRFEVIPVNRGSGEITSIYASLHALKEGKVIALFPQGTRCPGRDPNDTKLYNGVGMMIYRANVPVLPVSIYVKNYTVKLFRKTYVTYGDLIYPEELGFTNGCSEEYANASRLIFDKILELDQLGRARAERNKP